MSDETPITLEQPLPPPRGRVRVAMGLLALAAALPLLVLGAVVSQQAVGALVLVWKAHEWQPLEVMLEDVTLVETSSPFGPRRQVVARYTWELGGAKHFGTRVGAEAASDDPFQLERHALLADHLARRAPFTAVVDPAAPTQVLLFRDPTERLLIAPLQGSALLILGGVTVGLALRLLRRPRRTAAPAKRDQ